MNATPTTPTEHRDAASKAVLSYLHRPTTQVAGRWHYDPVDQAWIARIGDHRWIAVGGGLDNSPTFSPPDMV